MNKKTVIILAVLMIVGTLFGLVAASASNPVRGIHAHTRLVEHVFRGIGERIPWAYIYVINPTWQSVDVESIQLDLYVNGVFYPEWSAHFTPDWRPERWDTKVLPFETSVVLWLGAYTEEGFPEGIYVWDFTIYATVMGENIGLKTKCEFTVSL